VNNECNTNTPDKSLQGDKRLVLAAGHLAQAALLVEQARREVIGRHDESRLSELVSRLRGFIDPLREIGRATDFAGGAL
jgi:hypothetical protein